MSEHNRPKTRNLTTFEFFEVVQVEYICAILRSRIYIHPKDKSYWARVADGKREVIDSIALRNHLPSIFTDSDLEATLSRKIYRENSHPLFCYKDDKQKEDQEYYDLLYYYSKGSECRFDNDGETMVGKIVKYTPFDKIALVQLKSSETTVEIEIENLTRIL